MNLRDANKAEKANMNSGKKNFSDWKEKRFYESGAADNPDYWVWVDHPTHSDWYNKERISYFADVARKNGVDPYDFIALGISESGLGNQHFENPTRVNRGVHFPGVKDVKPEELIDFSAKYLSEQLKKYGDREAGIQAYSGTGKTVYSTPLLDSGGNIDASTNPSSGKFFGKKKKDTDYWKEKPQAKRVIDIAEKIKTDPAIFGIVEGTDEDGQTMAY